MKRKILYYYLFAIVTIITVVIVPKEVKADTEIEKNTLIIETSNIDTLDKYEDIISIDKISDDIYCVNYENEQKATQGLKKLEENDEIINACSDVKVSILENDVNEKEISSLSINKDYYAWGVSSTGINHYLTKLSSNTSLRKIKIAVLDTGINSTHEIFFTDSGRSRIDLSNSYNYINYTSDVSDNNGHGTQVAGLIAESTLDNVTIMPVKVLDSEGNGKLSNILLAVNNIKDKVDIINLSLGIKPAEIDSNTLEMCEKIFKSTYDLGVITTCAAGNDGENYVYYPACSSYTMAVSSIDKNNQFANFSNYGNEVDFALPGVDLIIPSNKDNTSYYVGDGTSFSTPFLSAAIALIKTENYNYSINQVMNVLKNNVEDLGTSGKDPYFGYGSLNFDTNMFRTPGIAETKVYKQAGLIIAYAYSGSNLISYAVTNTGSTPKSSEWSNFKTVSKDIIFSVNIKSYGIYYIWVKNAEGKITYKKVEVPIFEDVSSSSWYYNAVKYTYENNIMKGLDELKFGPNNKLTRGMMVTILYRMEGSPNISGTPKFPDVQDSSKYYYKAVKWATDKKIVSGYNTRKIWTNR